MNILILDDHEIILSGFKNIFKTRKDYNIYIASKTHEARNILADQEIDLLVSDVSLKGEKMNGLEFCTEVKSKYPKLKILIYTQLSFIEVLVKIKESHFDGVIFKEDKNEELFTAVDEILKGNRYFSSTVKEILFDNYTGVSKEDKYSEIILTSREEEILQKVVEGKKDREIATELLLSARTIETYVGNLILKFKARNRVELVTTALKKGKAKLG